MARFSKTAEQLHAVVGSRRSVLTAVSVGFLAVFVALVVALIVADLSYVLGRDVSFWQVVSSPSVLAGIRMSLFTSLVTLALVMLFAVPIGYALSRFRFPGRSVIDTFVDVPIVLPPVVIGLSLLALFATPLGSAIRSALAAAGWSITSAIGIVLCQFLVSISYCIRATKAAFDSADVRLEHVAMSLGCSPWQAFRRVTLPLARPALIAGGVMAWARALGVFGPLMILVGTSPRVQVMPTAIWLEMSVGNTEAAFAIALVSLALAGAALVLVHWLAPGRTWT